jgi:hypothetical protein
MRLGSGPEHVARQMNTFAPRSDRTDRRHPRSYVYIGRYASGS